MHLLWALVLLCICACGVESGPRDEVAGSAELEPATEANRLRNAYFGDLHVHTKYSLDSYTFGNQLSPRDAYLFARGGVVTVSDGASQQLAEPLDFAAVTDHVETLVEYARCVEGSGEVHDSPFCAAVRTRDSNMMTRLRAQVADRPQHHPEVCPEGPSCSEAVAGPWREIRRAAEEFYEPGRFTTFIAYEYSPPLEDGGMLHRNEIFRGSEVPEVPLGFFELPTAQDLWRWLDMTCTGPCKVLSIPHNTNFSWGLAFTANSENGGPLSRRMLQTRAELERLVEIIQHKGSSECAVGVGTTDEECAFEQIFEPCTGDRETACAREGSYARDALASGLAHQREIGFNPFKLGFIGSTDTHEAIPGAVEEDRYLGHFGTVDDSTAKRLTGNTLPAGTHALLGERAGNALYNPGGLAGVWAESNTRESIYDALRRRETFATSGPRIRVRLFGGWDYASDLHLKAKAVALAYEEGVPMGGDLPLTSDDRAPRFLVLASKDPEGADLDRIELIKVWVVEGEKRERIYDVACSDGREADSGSGRCARSGAGVDLSDCSVAGGRGAAELGTVWIDPDFDPRTPALYYVRVLENPTCRWTTLESLRTGLPPPAQVPATIQERSWSSPIWYSPPSLRK